MLPHCLNRRAVKASLETANIESEWQKANQGLLSVSKQIRLIADLSFFT
jgi:hypothetical protein